MIKIIFKGEKHEFEFPPVTERNSPVSLTDYGKPGTEIVLIDDKGAIKVSEAGLDTEIAHLKVVVPFKLIIEKELKVKEVYERDFTSRYEKGKLIITRID